MQEVSSQEVGLQGVGKQRISIQKVSIQKVSMQEIKCKLQRQQYGGQYLVMRSRTTYKYLPSRWNEVTAYRHLSTHRDTKQDS